MKFAYLNHPEKKNSIFFGIKLKSIRIAPLEERTKLDEFALDLLSRQMDVIHSLHQLEADITYDLRYLFCPDEPNLIHVYMLISIADQPNAESILRKGIFIFRLLQVNNVYLKFEPIKNKDDLEFFLKPFNFLHFLEIVRREDFIPLDSVHKISVSKIGFGSSAKKKRPTKTENRSSSIYHVFPFSTQLENMERLCNTLLLQDHPSLVSICLKPYSLLEQDEIHFEGRINLCEKFAQLDLDNPALMDLNKLAPFLKMQAQVLYNLCSSELVQLQDACFLKKVQIASSKPISKELGVIMGSTMTEHSGHSLLIPHDKDKDNFTGGYDLFSPDTPKQKKTAERNLKRMEFTLWIPSIAPPNLSHLRYLFNVSQANAGFRLPLSTVSEFPGLETIQYQNKLAPSDIPASGLLIGEHHHLITKKKIFCQHRDRRRHTYIVGQTGVGKSTMLLNMILQDIHKDRGVGFIDPHGELIDEILSNIPEHRIDDVVYLSPMNYEYPFGINLLEYKTEFEKDFCINYLMEVFDQLYNLRETGGPIFEMYMRNALQLLMDQPGDFQAAVIDVPHLFQNRSFRERLLDNTNNLYVRNFWINEAQKVEGDASLSNIAPYITSKLSRFIYNDIIRRIVGQMKSTMDFREIIDQGKILLVDLRKGILGETNSHFLGMTIVGKILTAALSRTDCKDKQTHQDFFLYVDEFQNLATESFISILSEARKYRLSLILANQYIAQLPTKIVEGIFGNVGTIISFRIGSDDSQKLSMEFGKLVSEADLMGISNWNAYVRLLLNGNVSAPFHIKSILPKTVYNPDLMKKIQNLSGKRYGKNRDIVEKEIQEKWNIEY